MRRAALAGMIFGLCLALSPAVTSAQTPDGATIEEFASDYMRKLSKQGLADREIANQLVSTMYWMEKMMNVCVQYFYVNVPSMRFSFQLRSGAWDLMFGPGKTSAEIINSVTAKRNREFNNASSKKTWCEDVRAFGIKTFGWEDHFKPN